MLLKYFFSGMTRNITVIEVVFIFKENFNLVYKIYKNKKKFKIYRIKSDIKFEIESLIKK